MRGFRLALVCTSAFFCASIASAQDPYTDFRVPEARSFTWVVNGNARWSGSYSAFPGSNIDSRNAQGNLLSVAHGHAESEALVSDHFLEARANWTQTRATQRYANPSALWTYDAASDQQDFHGTAGGSTTRYLGASRWGIDAALFAFYDYTRAGNGSGTAFAAGTSESRGRADSEVHDYRGVLDASFGPGFGRVRDVTGVFDMQVLEERLEATGRLLHPLSPAARQRLAELFSVAGDFNAAHDRPDRYLWRDVERLLREDGALPDSTFDAWSLMRALEPATLSVAVTRLAGWRLSGAYELTLARGHVDEDQQFSNADFTNGVQTSGFTNRASDRESIDEDHGFGRLDVSWHRPFGMHWQADFASTGRYGDGHRRRVLVSSALGFTNVLADRWVLAATATHQAASLVQEGVRLSPEWSVHGIGQLSYFFEDSWSVAATFDQSQTRPFFSDGTNPIVPNGFVRETRLVLGLTYRPVGRFEAPGLHVAERLTPGGI